LIPLLGAVKKVSNGGNQALHLKPPGMTLLSSLGGLGLVVVPWWIGIIMVRPPGFEFPDYSMEGAISRVISVPQAVPLDMAG